MNQIKIIFLFLTSILNANEISINETHEKYGIIKWISNNSLSIDIIILSFIIIIILLFYVQRINKTLVKKKQKLEDALYELQKQKLALDEHAIVSITDTKGIITYVNKKFIQISGYSQKELLGQNHRILNSAQHDSQFWKNMYKTVSKGNTWKDSNICNIKKDGSYYWVDTTIVPFMKNGKPEHYVAIRTDITENKEIEMELETLYEESQGLIKEKEHLLQEIEKLAYNDALTNIPNRLSLMNSSKTALSAAQRNSLKISLMFIDLDGFKLINDTLDHQTGDRVLKEVANILKTKLREDDIYGRLGGDEFLIVTLASEDKSDLNTLCTKLLENINQIELPEPIKSSFGASIGVISTIPNQETSIELLLKKADNLMYEVKKKDKNNFLIQDL